MTRILLAFAIAYVALVASLTAYGHLLHTPAPRPAAQPGDRGLNPAAAGGASTRPRSRWASSTR
jgi:hypothetical protein